MVMAGLWPERTTDPAEAFLWWSIDGAAILTGGRTDAAGVIDGALAVFGQRLLARQEPSMVVTNSMPGEDTYYDPRTRTVHANADVQLRLHVDAYMAFGDYYPDLLCLLCASHAPAGGESFLVDGQRLLDALAADPGQRALARFLWAVPLEQSRPADAGPTVTGAPVLLRRPVASRTPAGRLTVRRHEHQRLPGDAAPASKEARLLSRWAELTEQAARDAPRFLLRPGDLLLVDNYRVFHGREPYHGGGRLLHKLWAWTEMCYGLPDPAEGRHLLMLEAVS